MYACNADKGSKGAVLEGKETMRTSETPDLSPDLIQNAKRPRKILISGHSLTDDPLGADLEQIAQSLGDEMTFEEQILPGSSIRARSRGLDQNEPTWIGYSQGRNRRGEGKNILAELAAPADGRPYEALLITERHDLAGVLIWEDTVRYLRHFHDRFMTSSPEGQTYFYESWLSIADKNRPQEWIDYERHASRAWRCVTTRVNAMLERSGRADRIVNLPAGLALAELVALATKDSGLPGFTRGSLRETVDLFVEDDVHPTRLGRYYLALFTYAALFGRSPKGAWAPQGVSAEQAAVLTKVAFESLKTQERYSPALSLSACRAYFRETFSDVFWDYLKRAHFEKDQNFLSAAFKKTKLAWEWKHHHFAKGDHNPLRDPGPFDEGD